VDCNRLIFNYRKLAPFASPVGMGCMFMVEEARKMHKLKYPTILIILIMVFSLTGLSMKVSARPLAQIAPPMGLAGSYSVLAHTGVTNSGPTSMTGDLGSDGGSIGLVGVTVGPPGTVRTAADALSAQGAANVTAVSGSPSLESQGPDNTLLSSELSGRTLTHGVYTVPGVALLSGGVLTLDGQGVFIFLTNGLTASGTVSLINGADACNVFWRDASSVAINNSGASGSFVGTIIALTSITFNTGARLEGRAIAQNGNVTLLSNTITGPSCATTTTTALSAGSIATGGSAYDTATLTGTNSSTAGGTVTYNVYSDIACTTLAQSSGPLPVIGGALPNSNSVTFSSAGTYYWRAAYSGDPLHQASASACRAEVLTVSSTPLSLPVTGFAPNRVTGLPDQSTDKAYAAMGDLWLEIPRLGVQMDIVGVPETGGTWDVSWLGKQAGWLNGSAFPTWAGNSVLTGHVWNADNTVGPFRYINTLWWGDKVIVHAWGAKYVYEVRSVTQVGPGNTAAMMKHETIPWVTLVTCRGYDQASDSYKYRVLVRAVLIEVK
jgi:LPXTG-site transpeptidase (sortase) family protein